MSLAFVPCKVKSLNIPADMPLARAEMLMNKQVLGHVGDAPITRGDLDIAFRMVRNHDHWKNPINTVVDLDEFTQAVVREAVIFFTGSVPTFDRNGGTTTGGMGRYHVKAKGYFRTIGA